MSEHKIDFSPGSLARKYIQNEFLNEKWNRFKIWFFDTYSNEDLNNISQEFYETCALHNHIMFFVPWFITTYLPLFINVLERSYKDESGNIIQSIYPPQARLFTYQIIPVLLLSCFHKFIDNEVKLIGEHICSLDKKLDSLSNLIVQIDNKLKSINKFGLSLSTKQPDVHIQRPPEIQDFILRPYTDLENLLDKSFLNLVQVQNRLVSLRFCSVDGSHFDFKLKWKWKLINFMGIQRGIVVISLMLENLACKHITIPCLPQDVLIEERD
ncbi:hypothetical protein H5410_007680 [Solanum commersonii]|uniref:DUF7588 domain-containing protein n=1 Tax=Solanum commersonii TaxID=4109 RepID=A0A9J6ACQ3_SOLCO|nr:hypothetical protein H5410_007680 [Solanum commersonii]